MLGWEWFTEPNTLSVFIYLLLSARHDAGCWRGIELEAGQCITSREKISQSTGLSIQEVRTSIARLKSTNEITTKTTNKYTIVTITNYVNYQGLEDNEQPTTQPTTQQTNNQQSTSNQPAINHKQEYKNNKNNRIKEYDIKSTTDVVPKKEDTGDFDYKGYLLSKGVELQYINDWLKYRKSIKKAVTRSVIIKLEREAERAGISLAYAVQLAAENSWQSFQASYLKDKPRTASLFNNDSEERARFEAQLEIERKKDVERRKAEQEREIEEYRQREIQRINNIIYGNNDNNDNNK